MNKKIISFLENNFQGDLLNQSKRHLDEQVKVNEQPEVINFLENQETMKVELQKTTSPMKANAAKSTGKHREIRATFIVDPDLLRKVKYISLVKDILLKEVISQALTNYVDAWERRNQKIRLPKEK